MFQVGFTVRASNGGLVVDGSSTANPQDVNYQRGKVAGPQTIKLGGEDTRLRVRRYFRTYNDSEDPLDHDLDIVFSVPRNGWTDASDVPLFADYAAGTDAKKPFAYRAAEMERKVRLSVDANSPLLKRGSRPTTVQLLLWRAGIDTKNVELVQSKGVTMYYTYGFPQVRRTPNSPDEIPTGVAADIVGQAGTILIFK